MVSPVLSWVAKAVALLAIVGVVAACSPIEGDGRHLVPLSAQAKNRLAAIGSSPQSAMLVRIFKQENELEVWKQTASGRYTLFRTYEICAWSGELGPKMREGDRQAPEGFYTVTPALMNPRSSYYLAFNLGFPNRFDREHGRTGSHLMVHGACSSAGCYAMEDAQIAEIYALARESFTGGQRSFQVQAFPFRMTAQNLAQHQSSPHYAFWQNLKQGYDYFEVANHPAQWDVCDGRYVFRQPSAANAAGSMAGACPAVQADSHIVSAFMAKQAADADALRAEIAMIGDAEARRVAQAERRERERLESEARQQAMNDTVNGIVGTVFSPFQNLFGQQAQQSQATGAVEIDPV